MNEMRDNYGMEELKDYDDLIKSMCGVDNFSMPRGIMGLHKEIVSKDGEIEVIEDMAFNNPILEMTLDGDYFIVDADFISPYDQNLKLCWTFLEDYYKDLREMELEEGSYLNLVAVFLPEAYEGEYSMIASDMIMYSLTANKPEAEITTVRFVFNSDQVVGGKSDMNEPE